MSHLPVVLAGQGTPREAVIIGILWTALSASCAIWSRQALVLNGAGYSGSAPLISSSTRLTGAPRLTESRTTFGSLGFPELTDSNFFLSSLFGPLLANSKPFSSLAASQKASAKLINDPAPFSSMLGLPVLSKH